MSSVRLRMLPLVVHGLLRVEVELRELVEGVVEVRQEAQVALARARYPELRPGLRLQDKGGWRGVVVRGLHVDPWVHLIGVRVRWFVASHPDEDETSFIAANTAWKMRAPGGLVQ